MMDTNNHGDILMKKICLLIIALLLSACATPTPSGSRTLTVMVHDSFSLSEGVLKQFETANNVKLNVLKSGDAGAVLNKAILSKDAPIADVIYGIDNTFMSRALKADILAPYAAPALGGIPDALKLDPSNRLLPVDFGYVSLNMDKAFLSKGVAPASLRELTDGRYTHNVVVQNAATSSPGLAFLMLTIAAFPADSAYPWQQFWRDLIRAQAHVSPDWSDAYSVQFSGSSGKGAHNFVVSYATSPAAEVFYSEGKLSEPPTSNLDIGAFQQVEFAGVLNGTKQPELARKFIDFLLSPAVQSDIPTQMWVYPAVKDTPLPDIFKFAAQPTQFYSLSPDVIDANREKWIAEWTKIVAGG
jgi:thiamine transport system substrate-binding protein